MSILNRIRVAAFKRVTPLVLHKITNNKHSKVKHNFECFIAKLFLFIQHILGTNNMFRAFNRPSSG